MLAARLDQAETDLFARLVSIYDGPDRSRAFDALLEPLGHTDLVKPCIDTYRSHRPTIDLIPEAEVLLARLLEVVPVGVVTDGPLVMQEATVAALVLRAWGVEVVCTDAIGGRDT